MLRRALFLPSLFVALFAGALVFGSQDDVKVEIHDVAGKVSYLVGQGGNIGLFAGDDGVLMVDSQFAQLAPKIAKAIEEHAGSQPVFLVNTHWHGDHTGGNEPFAAGATILAHANVRRRMAGDETIGGNVETNTPAAALPVVTYEDGISIHMNGEEVRLIHLPRAHTDGDTVVWFPETKVVHMGDLFFQSFYPFIDVNSGGDVEGIIAAAKRVLEMVPADTKIIPGHGEVTDPDGLREYLEMLETITGLVREGMAVGRTAEEMVADGITQQYDERWGGSNFVTPAKLVQAIIDSLK